MNVPGGVGVLLRPSRGELRPHDMRSALNAALRNVARHADDADLKNAVMLAREHGHLSDDETEFYIAAWGLVNA